MIFRLRADLEKGGAGPEGPGGWRTAGGLIEFCRPGWRRAAEVIAAGGSVEILEALPAEAVDLAHPGDLAAPAGGRAAPVAAGGRSPLT